MLYFYKSLFKFASLFHEVLGWCKLSVFPPCEIRTDKSRFGSDRFCFFFFFFFFFFFAEMHFVLLLLFKFLDNKLQASI